MACHGGRPGRLAVEATVAGRRAAGIQASGLIRKADFGHVARAILDAAGECGARVIVLGACRRIDSPHLPLGGVATQVPHRTRRPVLTVPQADGGQGQADPLLASPLLTEVAQRQVPSSGVQAPVVSGAASRAMRRRRYPARRAAGSAWRAAAKTARPCR